MQEDTHCRVRVEGITRGLSRAKLKALINKQNVCLTKLEFHEGGEVADAFMSSEQGKSNTTY